MLELNKIPHRHFTNMRWLEFWLGIYRCKCHIAMILELNKLVIVVYGAVMAVVIISFQRNFFLVMNSAISLKLSENKSLRDSNFNKI